MLYIYLLYGSIVLLYFLLPGHYIEYLAQDEQIGPVSYSAHIIQDELLGIPP